jgi:hypothetical protein
MLHPQIRNQDMLNFDPFCMLVGRINLINHPKRDEAVRFFPSIVMNSRRIVQIFPEPTTSENKYFRMLQEVFGSEVIKKKNTPEKALALITHSKMKEGVLLKGVCGRHSKHTLSQPSFWNKVALTIFTIGAPDFFKDSPEHQAEFLAIFEVLATDKKAGKKWADECEYALRKFKKKWPPTEEINKIKQKILLVAGVYQFFADPSGTPFESKEAESKSETIRRKQNEREMDLPGVGTVVTSYSSLTLFPAAPTNTPDTVYEIHPRASYWLGEG